MKKKPFLVPGGTGFIGSNISKLLVEKKGKDSTSVGLFIFLNFLLSFFIFEESVSKIVKIIFFPLKKFTILLIFINFFLKYFLGFFIL